ncbi:MAG: hypothetical protein IJY57_00125 [Clostridia bacterium]|nr:hypothetical protein [Clostridia bacterium]
MTYGIIKKKDGSTYVSPIFALKYVGWKSEAIVFDETFKKIKKIKMWDLGFRKINRNIFVLENDFDIIGRGFSGYDWVINDKSLFKALKSNKGVSIEKFPLFKDYCKNICVPKFIEIKNEKDIATLENVAFGFHDSLICEYEERGDSVVIRFDTTWGCYITVTFDGIIDADFNEKVGLILDSEIKKTEDGFSFKVLDGFAGWIDGCDYNAEMGEPYIKCKNIFWQIEIA